MKQALIAALFAILPFAASAQDVRVIITFNGAPDEGVVTRQGGQVLINVPTSNLIGARIAAARVAALSQSPNVAMVVEDAAVEAAVVQGTAKPGGGGTTQPAQSTPWGIARIGAPAAWSLSRGAGVTVAVIDTGILSTHSDFKNAAGTSRVILGPTYVSGTSTSKDDNGHGTHCAGTIGASDNAIGVIGVAPDCTLLAVKVLDKRGSGWLSNVIAGIDWAAANGADVISLSLGSTGDVQAMHDSVDNAVAAGVVVVAAAGNDGDRGSPASYPGAYASAIAVAATDSSDLVAYFSTRGSYVDIAGPGVAVLSTWKDGGYNTISGTSMATPHVAGTAALVIGSGTTGVAAVRAKLETTADDINGGLDPDVEIGHGLVDADESVLP